MFLCQQGQGLPVNPLFSEDLGVGGTVSGHECQGCVSWGGLKALQRKQSQEERLAQLAGESVR